MKNFGGLILLFGMIIYLIINIGIYIIIATVVVVMIWLIIRLIKSSSSNNNVPSKITIDNSLSDETKNTSTLETKSEPISTVATSSVNYSLTRSNNQLEEREILNDFLDKLSDLNSDPFSVNIVNRTRKYQQSFSNSTWSKDSLYAHIIGIANNTIKISRHSIDKGYLIRECNAIKSIITQLQENAAFIDIVGSLQQETPCFEHHTNQNDCNKEVTLTPLQCNSAVANMTSLSQQHEDLELCIKWRNNGVQLETKGDLNGAINNYIKSSGKAKDCASYLNFHKAQLCLADIYKRNSDQKNELTIIKETIAFLSSIGHPLRYWNDRLVSLNDEASGNNIPIHHKQDDNGITEIIYGVLASHSQNKETITMKSQKQIESVCNNSIPSWSHFYVYSADDINRADDKQKEFYCYFKSEFLRNNCIDIADNWNYAFVLMFDLIKDYKNHNSIDKIQEQLDRLSANYSKTAPYTKQALKKAMYRESSTASSLSVSIDVSDILAKINNELKPTKEKLIQKCKWINERNDIEVDGIKLKRGSFYLGEKFLLPEAYRNYWGSDSPYLYASVLNPELSTSSAKEPLSTTFSSYTDMTPHWRYQYLQWLSGDVSVEDVSLDVLFLYLHGLEIKMFIDKNTTDNQRSDILKNIIQLKTPTIERAGIYDYAIKSFFNTFIDCAITKYFPSTPLEYVPETELKEYRTYKNHILEQAIGEKRAISCDFAYSLAMNTLDFNRIIPCKYNNHLRNRFDHHFKTQHPRGLRISKSEGHSRQSYSIMSRNITNKAFEPEHRYISSEIYESKFNIWEISNAINEPYWAIEREFSSYNKFIIDNEGKETLFAIFALPNYINIYANEKVIAFKTYIETNFGNNKFVTLELNELLRLCEYSRKEEKTLHKKYVDAIIGAFQVLGYGITPDYNIDKKRFDFNDKVVLYQNSELAKVGMNNIYARMEVFVKMAAHILYSNSTTTEDRNFICNYISRQGDIEINQKHLEAYLELLLLSKQRFDTKLKDVIPLLFNESRRIETSDALVGLCCIGGSVNSKRVEVVKKILPLFGIDNSDIHSRIHRIFTGEMDNFVTIEKQSNAAEFGIPKKEDIKPRFYIDTNKLTEIENETRESQKILSEIFDNEDTTQIVSKIEAPNTDLEILNILLTKESWSRTEVESICKERGLMIGSLLEKLNDYAYDKVNDSVIEDDGEIIYITTEYKEQLI